MLEQNGCLFLCVVFFFIPNAIHLGNLAADGELGLEEFMDGLLAKYTTPGNWSVWMFLFFLIISRTGLWIFDLAERQIMQVALVISS